MSGAYNLPDYCAKYFEYKVLDKIHGQPTLEALVKLFRQLKRNSQKVPTTLGGGQLGYLFLVLKTRRYTSVPGSAPVVRPVDPGNLSPTPNPIPPGPVLRGAAAPVAPPLTAGDIATQNIAHDERRRQYNECQAVEHALLNQLTEAIDDEYLRPLRNVHTDSITDPIPDILDFLQNTYGKLTTGQLKAKEAEVDDTVYDPSVSVDSVFNKVQDLQDICTLLGKHKTDTQLVDMSYLIFQKSGIFMDSLLRWNKKASVDQTFTNLKSFMRNEYLALQEVGGLTVNNSILNQANIAQQINEIKEHQDHVALNLKNELADNIMKSLKALNMGNENISPSFHPYGLGPAQQYHSYMN